ncbi:uncharacterized protein B0H64DRAFT_62070 [Chaetomium fimeti]|uniref:Uncharacterized protein n=1 Tax=Chaetomium fimeti TaxID=1854472 RepID=A0AAE0LMM2_9PEZI|nr:hypothetical protein B0H64DRAFT_62070 [Chaetomium fimeti]
MKCDSLTHTQAAVVLRALSSGAVPLTLTSLETDKEQLGETIACQASQSALPEVSCVRGGQCKQAHPCAVAPVERDSAVSDRPVADAAALQGAAGEKRVAIGPAHSGPNTNTPVTRSRYEVGRRSKRVVYLVPASMESTLGTSVKPSSHRTALLAAGPRAYRTLRQHPAPAHTPSPPVQAPWPACCLLADAQCNSCYPAISNRLLGHRQQQNRAYHSLVHPSSSG